MKRSIYGILLLFFLALLMGVSCAGAPPAEETPPASGSGAAPAGTETPQPQPQVQAADEASLDALDAAASRAEAARRLADDFGGADLFSSDWNSADSLFTDADGRKNSSTRKDAEDSAARYNAAADAFDALNQKIIAHYYAEAEKTLTEARASAVNGGAETLTPDFLLHADETTAGAYEKYQAKDYYGAKDDALSALSMYDVLATGLKAYQTREEIADRGFEPYDPANIATADDSLASAVLSYSAGDYAAAGEKADSALSLYTAALSTAWESYAAEMAAAAAGARQKAIDLKANVAVKQNFDFAQIAYGQANAAFARKDFEEAAGRYTRCESTFEEIAASALEKKLAAEEALRLANQRMAESDETAKNAEIILEGGGE